MKRKRLSKGLLISIITSALILVAALAILITNIYIPVKYLSAYLVTANRAVDGELRVSFLDVGYGDCTLVEFPDGRTMLIDSGNGRYGNQLKLLKLLNGYGVDNIDYLVCTSVKNERCGGFGELLKYKAVGKVYMPYCLSTQITDGYRAFCEAVKSCGAKTEICEYGAGERGDGYEFCFLSPSVHTLENGEYDLLNKNPNETNINNASAALWLECGGVSFLFLGDVNSEIEAKICADYLLTGGQTAAGYNVRLENCKIVKAANHGKITSACAALYDLIKPETVIISVGENGQGCPSQDVISDAQRYAGENLYRTDYCGTVTVTAKDGSYRIEKEKK